MSISALIMTYNEEVNLPRCLASLDWCDDIVVLDSFSTDKTVEIAKAAGARVFQRVHDSEVGQRMFGITEISYKNPWLYLPDADEVTPDDLRDEMLALARNPSTREVLFRARYRNMFMGRWIKRSSLYPTWIARLVRPDKVRFERLYHSKCIGDGPSGELRSHFDHYSFNKGIAAWYDKHNRYSSAEAEMSGQVMAQGIDWQGLASREPERRRNFLKQVSYRLPMRPILRFFYMYLVRGGLLDGWPGLVYCSMLASYEFMIVTKIAEQKRRELGLSI